MRARILVVDDSATMRALHVYHLQSAGYETVQADSGFAALEVLREARCSLALVDINMPRMDGFTLTRRIREDKRNARPARHLVYHAAQRGGPCAGPGCGCRRVPDQTTEPRGASREHPYTARG